MSCHNLQPAVYILVIRLVPNTGGTRCAVAAPVNLISLWPLRFMYIWTSPAYVSGGMVARTLEKKRYLETG